MFETSKKVSLYIKLPILMTALLFISLAISQSSFLLNQHQKEMQSIAVITKKRNLKQAYLSHLEQGNRYLQAEMYAEAQLYYEKALSLDADFEKEEAKNGLNKTLLKMDELNHFNSHNNKDYLELFVVEGVQ